MEFTCPLPADLQDVLDELESRLDETRNVAL
jgi:hypothetical protein